MPLYVFLRLLLCGSGESNADKVLRWWISLLIDYPLPCKRTAMQEGVTDEGIHALATAGCGEKVTSLHLLGELSSRVCALFVEWVCVCRDHCCCDGCFLSSPFCCNNVQVWRG